MPINDDMDEFTPDLVDIVDDADAPPGRTEIGYQYEVTDEANLDTPVVVDISDIGTDNETEIGMDGISGEQTEIGMDGISGVQDEIGYLGDGYEGLSGFVDEIGLSLADTISGPTSPFELFMAEPAHLGGGGHGGHGGHHGGHGGGLRGGWGGPWPVALYDYGFPGYEIDDDWTPDDAAIVAVVKTARDSRMPPPRMIAVDADAPEKRDNADALTDTVIGAAVLTGADPFPLTTQLLQRFGAGGAARIVRIDTEESYEAFRAESSPDLMALRDKVAELSERFDLHEADPEAHDQAFFEGDLDNVEILGAAVAESEAQKRIDLWLPERFRRHVRAWREGDFVCASIDLPGHDGGLRICTSMEPIVKCIDEITRYATESRVPASTVVGALPSMGCALGAGTILKEMAAAAPSILNRPEAQHPAPFVVRIEPKASPALCALAALAFECREGNQAACEEWSRLSEVAPPVVKQAMGEALSLAKAL